MKNRLAAFLVVSALAPMLRAAEQSSCAFEMTAWRSTVPAGDGGSSVFSPAGFAIATAVIGEGLGGSARADLMESFGLISDFGFIGASHAASHTAANASNRVDVSVATSVWTTRRNVLDREFVKAVQRGFDAQAGHLRDVLPVNAWTEAKTEGRITNVLPEIPKGADTIVINAVAFEGAWNVPFDESLTRKSGFSRIDGKKTSLPMMRGEREMLIIDRPRFRLCQLDFAAPKFHFLLVLPKKGVTLKQLREKDITVGTMDGLKALLKARSGDGVKTGVAEFALPVFDVRSQWKLDSALKTAKIPRKGFERMGRGPFTISDVRQFVYFKVTEAGYSLTPGFTPEQPQKGASGRRTELSSASDEQESGRSKPRLGAPIVCDRPFLFFVWDAMSDSFVIAGQFTGDKS